MSAARIAGEYITAWCRQKFAPVAERPELRDEHPEKMASTVANGNMIDVFDHKGSGSHKYIPADRLTQDLGEPLGAGVFSYWKMYDDSYLLRTCDGRLAHWSGKDEDKAEWCS
jgi:hypothetical protein